MPAASSYHHLPQTSPALACESEMEEDPESQIPRAVSPAPTEILDDPPVEEILANLKSLGIKIRDFGATEAINTTRQKSSPATEIFDPYRGIAEFEYRLGFKKATRRPVAGKTLRRLLDLGWITKEEIDERCEEMDMEALREYDERVKKDVREGRGVYPWRALRWTHIPTMTERSAHVLKHVVHLVAIDKARKHLEELERRDRLRREEAETDQRLAEEIMERRRKEEEERVKREKEWVEHIQDVEERTRAEEATMSRKRSLTDLDKIAIEEGHASPKRIRLSSPPAIIPPEKQYPAPLSSYDPKLYPDAAIIIGSQSQSQKQYQDATPPGTPREGTPPIEDVSLTPYASPGRIQRMMRSQLGRTQTLTFL